MKQLPISMWTDYFWDLTPNQAIDELSHGGYTHCELADSHAQWMIQNGADVEKTGREFAAYARDKGVDIPQGHLYFKMDLCDHDNVDMLKIWLDFFNAVGIKNCVFHAASGGYTSGELLLDIRIKHLSELVDHIKDTDMRICLENLGGHPTCYTSYDLFKMIDAVGDEDHLGICLDTGHLHKVKGRGLADQELQDFVRHVGKRLHALHINSNNGDLDDHLMPYSGKKCVNFKPFMLALDEIGYDGIFNLELPGESKGPLELRRIRLRHMYEICQYLMSDSFLYSDHPGICKKTVTA